MNPVIYRLNYIHNFNMSELTQVLQAIKSMDEKLNLRINNIEQQNNTIIENFNTLSHQFEELSVKQNQLGQSLTSVHIEIEKLKQKAIGGDIIISGIPNTEEIKIFDIVDSVCKYYKLTINEIDYNKMYQLKSKHNKSDYTTICVEFNSRTFKSVLLKQKKKLGPVMLNKINLALSDGDMRKVIVKNRMTQYFSNLLKEAYSFKEKYKFQYVWFQDNEILMKKTESSKPNKIESKMDLIRLAAKIDDAN